MPLIFFIFCAFIITLYYVFLFSFVFVYVWGFGVVGVWYGIATSVLTGMILSLFIANQVALPLIGGIFSGQETRKANISNNHPI